MEEHTLETFTVHGKLALMVNVSRFKGKVVKMIKYVNGRFEDYSFSPKIRQILLHWGYELVEKDLLRSIFLFI